MSEPLSPPPPSPSSPQAAPVDRFYQAIGTIQGIILLDEPAKVQIGDQVFPIFCPPKLKRKITPDQPQVLRVYPKGHQDGLRFQLSRIPKIFDPTPRFTLNGCWCSTAGGDRLMIFRNLRSGMKKNWRPVGLPLSWENAPPTDGRFWQIQALLKEGKLVVIHAEGPYPPPPRYNPFAPPPTNPQPQSKTRTGSPDIPPPPPLSSEDIRAMATPAKVEVTCKINEVPPHRLVATGVVEFFLADGDRIFTVRLKQKQFKKLAENGFTHWVGAISGQLGAATPTGFELNNASLQVFERKPKGQDNANPEQPGQPTEPATAQSTAPPADKVKKDVQQTTATKANHLATTRPAQVQGKFKDIQFR
uniref:Uncharacterized protein n=1 Tax=Cyanothece sp. (strain PCC 7425 / ATCC 29141) TaxID=395961 RepID=B8HZA7_CYAP4